MNARNPAGRTRHPHGRDAERYQPERRHFRRLADGADGFGQRHPRLENGETARRDCGGGRHVVSPAGAGGGHGRLLCLGRIDRPHLDENPGRSLGATLHAQEQRSSPAPSSLTWRWINRAGRSRSSAITQGNRPPPSRSPIDSGPETSVVSTGSLGSHHRHLRFLGSESLLLFHPADGSICGRNARRPARCRPLAVSIEQPGKQRGRDTEEAPGAGEFFHFSSPRGPVRLASTRGRRGRSRTIWSTA